MESKLLFNKESLPLILNALDKTIDIDGFVCNKDGAFVLDADDNKFKATELIGILKDCFITDIHQISNI